MVVYRSAKISATRDTYTMRRYPCQSTSNEEKKHMLTKLESAMAATRFMTLKHINTSVIRNSIDFVTIEVQDPKFIEKLVKQVQSLSKDDKQDLIRKEAEQCVKNLGKKLHPDLAGGAPVCEECKERLVITYKHCPKCGADVTKQQWIEKYDKCPKCNGKIEEKWTHCTACGELLKKEEEKEEKVKVCPYCASKLKLTIPQK